MKRVVLAALLALCGCAGVAPQSREPRVASYCAAQGSDRGQEQCLQYYAKETSVSPPEHTEVAATIDSADKAALIGVLLSRQPAPYYQAPYAMPVQQNRSINCISAGIMMSCN